VEWRFPQRSQEGSQEPKSMFADWQLPQLVAASLNCFYPNHTLLFSQVYFHSLSIHTEFYLCSYFHSESVV
jgi:hypothetical protein